MVNERGFYKSNGFSFDEQEIINDFNGNLMYQLPLYNYPLAGDLNFNLTLNYNGSVGHQLFIGDTTSYGNTPDLYRYNMNSPEWILSFNGIAVQVLNFETNFFFNSTQNSDTTTRGLIQGYHFDGGLQAAGSESGPNRIFILAGDGSVISLVNASSATAYVGDYISEDKESYYKAKVTYIESSGGTDAYRRRKVELLKGDGTVIIFKEYKQNFADFRVDALVNERRKPMMLLPEEFKDNYGHYIKIDYNFVDPNPVYPTTIFGRPLVSKISAIGYYSQAINVEFEFSQMQLNIIHRSPINGNYNILFYRPVFYTPYSGEVHKAYIKTITNCLSQRTVIDYEEYKRQSVNLKKPGSPPTLDLFYGNMFRIKSFDNTLGGKRTYSYLGGTNLLTVNGANRRMKSQSGSYYKGYGRDAFYTNLLTQRFDINKTVDKSKTDYSYEYEDRGNSNADTTEIDKDDLYLAYKDVYSLNYSTLNKGNDTIRHLKRYVVYPSFDLNSLYLENPDVDGMTKLVSDSTAHNSFTTGTMDGNSYIYELGSFTNGYYTGSFLMTGRTNKKSSFTRSWAYSYTYKNNSFDSLVTSKTETDPLGNKSYSKYENLYKEKMIHTKMSNSRLGYTPDTTIFYKTGIVTQEKKLDASNNVLLRNGKGFILDTSNSKGYYGQLLYDTLFSTASGDYIITEYEYYKNDFLGNEIYNEDFYPFKEGNLKIIRKLDQESKYFYNPITSSEVVTQTGRNPRLKYKVKYTNYAIKDTASDIWDTRLPIRIDNYKINGGGRDTLSKVYKSYTMDGSPTKLIDQYKYLTEIEYQPIHRVNSITLPGDFSTTPNEYDTIVVHHYQEDTLYLFSNSWGRYWHNQDIIQYQTNPQGLSTNNCSFLFQNYKYYMSGGTRSDTDRSGFFGFDGAAIKNFDSIYSADFSIWPKDFFHTINGDPKPDSNDYSCVLHPVSSMGTLSTIICKSPNIQANSKPGHYEEAINQQIFVNATGSYTLNTYNVKNILTAMNNNNKDFLGMILKININDIPDGVTEAEFHIVYNGYTTPQTQDWVTNYSPRMKIIGRTDFPDTIVNPIVHGGTILYSYDNVRHFTDVRAVRRLQTNEIGRTRFKIDGFGNVYEKNIYTSSSDSNTFKYRFNFLNKPATSFDALNDSTMLSYDAIERLIKTKNADTSSSLNSYSYQNSLSTYFGGSYSGFIEKQGYTDEENKNFDKFYDAVGNLRREVKYISSEIEFDIPLPTDYWYDSLYRLTKVKTAGGRNIRYTYDSFSRQNSRTTDDNGLVNYIYDKYSNLTYTQDAGQRGINSGKYTFRNYDGLNRLTGIGERIFMIDSPSDGSQYETNSPTDYLTINVYDSLTNKIVPIFDGVPGFYDSNYVRGNLISIAYRTRSSDPWNYKYYRYDIRSRVICMWNIIAGFDTLITTYEYNSQDQVTKYSHMRNGDWKTFRNSYDYAGRMSKVQFYVGSPSDIDPEYRTLTDYLYNPNSQIDEKKFADDTYGNEYYYNNRGWVAEMTSKNSNAFSFINDYFKNGNIKQQNFEGSYNDNFTDTRDIEMLYTYDKSNRMLTAGKSHDFLTTNTYDNDGNIITMKRYTNLAGMIQNYNYSYYSGTNRLQKIYGSNAQYVYDENGNVIEDTVSRNHQMLYDYRNLLIQVRHKQIDVEDSTIFVSQYYYDEAGNRIRKLVSIEDHGSWIPYKDEVYSRNVNGEDFALYIDDQIKQTNIIGLGNEGYLSESDDAYYYQKDHLGSVRAVLDKGGSVISAQDYDAWGFILQGRSYESGISTYKFTGKERDNENDYDYFGARYYDSRIGRWGQNEPLFDKYLQYSPYQYCLLNPLVFIDGNGMDVYIDGDEDEQTRVQNTLNVKNSALEYKIVNGQLTITNSYNYEELTSFEKAMVDAVNDPNVNVNLKITTADAVETEEGMQEIIVGAYMGSEVDSQGKVKATQYFNFDQAVAYKEAGGGSVRFSIMHEIVEAHYGGVHFPGMPYSYERYLESHNSTMLLLPGQKEIGLKKISSGDKYKVYFIGKGGELIFFKYQNK